MGRRKTNFDLVPFFKGAVQNHTELWVNVTRLPEQSWQGGHRKSYGIRVTAVDEAARRVLLLVRRASGGRKSFPSQAVPIKETVEETRQQAVKQADSEFFEPHKHSYDWAG
jgi:hypothetical protein